MNKSKAPKLLLDEHIWVYLATLLRKQGYDVYHVAEVGLDHTPDLKIFQAAVEDHRAVVTFNIKDYIPFQFNTSKTAGSITASSFPTKFRRANYKDG